MHFLRKMQEGLPHGCGDDRQFQEEKKRNGLYPVYGMRKGLPEEGAAIGIICIGFYLSSFSRGKRNSVIRKSILLHITLLRFIIFLTSIVYV